MHVSCPPAKPVKQPSLASTGDMSAFWKLAARMQLCHVPVRLQRATASIDVVTRSSAGTFGFIPFGACYHIGMQYGLLCTGMYRPHPTATPCRHHTLCTATVTGESPSNPHAELSSISAKLVHPTLHTQCADAREHQSKAESQEPLPPKLGGAEIRERFLQFFEKHHHVRLPSSSLIPDDPTVLLTIAGMLQFKSIFMGQVGPGHSASTSI